MERRKEGSACEQVSVTSRARCSFWFTVLLTLAISVRMAVEGNGHPCAAPQETASSHVLQFRWTSIWRNALGPVLFIPFLSAQTPPPSHPGTDCDSAKLLHCNKYVATNTKKRSPLEDLLTRNTPEFCQDSGNQRSRWKDPGNLFFNVWWISMAYFSS